jgi:hypothetical protein
MVLAAFLISSAAVLVALALFQGAQNAAQAKARDQLLEEASVFLANVEAPDADHAKGSFEGLPVELTLHHHEIDFAVTLPHSVLPFTELVETFASPALKAQVKALGLSVDAKDRVIGGVPREPGLGENLISIANRLPVAVEIAALRAHAPRVLVDRIATARAAYDVDQVLVSLTRHFPDAPETAEAIEVAAEREHAHPDRIRERAERWLARA